MNESRSDTVMPAAAMSGRRLVLGRLGGGLLGGTLALLVARTGAAKAAKRGKRRENNRAQKRDHKRARGRAEGHTSGEAAVTTEIISACYDEASGTLRRIDEGEACLPSEQALVWSGDGMLGPVGPLPPLKPPVGRQSFRVRVAPAGNQASLVFCLPGEQATGGGFDLVGEVDGSVVVTSSRPIPASEGVLAKGWEVRMITHPNVVVQAWVICASSKP